jgi:3-oxoacyl-[acyl-carrier protein] reductase
VQLRTLEETELTMAGRLAQKTVVITGAGSGMGAATARLFAKEGAKVIVVDIDRTGAEAIAAEIAEGIALVADVSVSAQVDGIFAAVERDVGAIDVVVHAAGIDDTKTKRDIEAGVEQSRIVADMSDEQWQRLIRVNLDGSFHVLRAALRLMVPRRAGSIVMVASIGGIHGSMMVNYSASKGGVLAMMRSTAKQVWSSGIRVNAIAPGQIDTPMLSRTPKANVAARAVAPGKPEDVASTALFLATDDSRHISGETIIVAGPTLTI